MQKLIEENNNLRNQLNDSEFMLIFIMILISPLIILFGLFIYTIGQLKYAS